ncbi:MAG TPA: trypsin-like peptidase domain-containing protein [Humisphaera sp.]
MGSGFGRSLKASWFVLVGLSGLMVSCSGAATAPATRASATLKSSAGGAAAGREARPLRVDDEFDAPSLERQFEAVAKRIIPSVVAISAIETPVADESLLHPDTSNPERLNAALSTYDRTVGTGFVIDSAGYILTNEHVVGRNVQIWVTTDDRRVYPAVVVATDPRSDLAVLKIPATHLPALRFSDADVRRGMWTMAIGNPYGLAGDGEMAVSVGVVSAVGRSLPKLSGKEDRLYSDLIQTTAQINPGNSGGPLFDLNGDVIGVNCAVILPVKQTNGIGFAIPVGDRLRSIVRRLKGGEGVTYAYLGVRTTTPAPAELRAAGLKDDAGGAKVEHVEPGSPAEAGGMKAGDVIVSLGGRAVSDSEQFIVAVGDAPVGSPVPVVVRRDGRSVSLLLTLRQREVSQNVPVTGDCQRFIWRGVTLGSTKAGVVVVAVDARSPLAGKVKAGDVVTTFAGRSLRGLPELLDVLAAEPIEKCELAVGSAAPGGQVAAARE